MPNGLSIVEVILRLGPEAGSDSINSLQTSIKENDGELELSNGASAKLISVEILSPGMHIVHCKQLNDGLQTNLLNSIFLADVDTIL